ncbi:MAG: hypothetical protein E7597_02275 [Ruminococcaceae bacterium]|nr:hypothetical protein [Oscillospiraceae bacterium]
MKNSKANNKIGYVKRLKNGSLILSCLGGLSSKLICFLKLSILSFLFSGGDKSDRLVEKSAVSKKLKQADIKKNVINKAKTTCARAIESSPVTKAYKKLITGALYTPASSYGAFFVTFGVYVGLVYCVKLYAFRDTDIKTQSLINACIIILSALHLLFSRKSVIKYLESSAFVRAALGGCIHFGVYGDKKGASALGTAIILGSVFGVLTFFFNELRVLLFIFVIILALVVLSAPELGLCAAALCLPFIERRYLVALICYTFGCYLTKVLRGKRNLHLDTGNIFVLFLLACFGFAAVRGGGINALFAFSATALYIMAANLLITKNLLKKCVQSLCLGFSGVIVIFLFQLFLSAYNKTPFGASLTNSFSVFEESGNLIKYCLVLLPFRFCKSVRSAPFSKTACYLLAAGLMCYSVYTGHVFFAVATSITVALYLTVSNRQIFAPLFLCVGVPLLALYFSGVSVDLNNLGAYNMVSGWVSALKASTSYPVLGFGMSAETLATAGFGDSRSMYLQTLAECGLTGFILLILAIVFAAQRMYTALPKAPSSSRRIAAAAGASGIMGLLLGFGNNLWQEDSICLVLWLSLGIASAACHTRMAEKREMDNELYR